MLLLIVIIFACWMTFPIFWILVLFQRIIRWMILFIFGFLIVLSVLLAHRTIISLLPVLQLRCLHLIRIWISLALAILITVIPFLFSNYILFYVVFICVSLWLIFGIYWIYFNIFLIVGWLVLPIHILLFIFFVIHLLQWLPWSFFTLILICLDRFAAFLLDVLYRKSKWVKFTRNL